MSDPAIEQGVSSESVVFENAAKYDNFIRFKPTEQLAVLLRLKHKTIALFSGNQGGKCLTYQTLIDTPHGHVPIGELYERGKNFDVYAWDGKKKVIAKAMPPFMKPGDHECYRVKMSDGRWVEGADSHMVMTTYGWISMKDLHDTYSHNLLGTSSVCALPIHAQDASRLTRKRSNFPVHCAFCFRQYGGPPLSGEGIDRVSFPSQAGAQERNFLLSYMGGLGNKHTYIHLLRSLFRLSSQGAVHRFLALFFDALYRTFCNSGGLCLQTQTASGPQFEAGVCDPPQGIEDRHGQDRVSLAYDTPFSVYGNEVVSCNLVGVKPCFDFSVPKYKNYFAGGLIHHNTSSVAYQYVMRMLGIHPLEEKNKLARKIRCMSSTLPESDSPEEQDNTQYLELKRLIPYEMIIRDVTQRQKNLVCRSPVHGKTVFEFRSSKQELQDTGKIQLSSVWHDEETPKAHREESKMRLLAEDGDEIFSLTPTNPLCFDEETELLTNRGWMRYDEVLFSDKILTYNIDGKILEWKNMNGFTIKRYNGEMIHLYNGSFDFLVTPNHKWVVCNDRRKNDKYLKETSSLNSKHIICRMSDVNIEYENKEYCDEEIALIGWAVSDGSICKSHTTIYQSLTAYPEKCAQIDRLAEKFGDDVKTSENDYGPTIIEGRPWDGFGRMKKWMISGNLRLKIKAVTDGKTINHDFICSLSKRQLTILFDAIIDGDGYRTACGGVRLAQSHNEKLLDDFQLISTLLGKISRKSRWVSTYGKIIDGVTVYSDSNRFWPNTHVKSLKIDKINYSGFIWCPSSENKTVVVRRNGCVSISGNSYVFDDIWQRASYVFRTKTISRKFGVSQVERPNKGTGIACIQMATEDNPTLDLGTVDRLFEDITDPDILAIRRYGFFKQSTGMVHKTYDKSICYIDFEKYFKDGIPYQWFHARGIDYHESRTPWSIGWLSASPDDEWFLWQEFHPAIDGPNSYNTYEIAKAILRKSGDYYYSINLIDPLARKKQPNTGFSAMDDLNRHFNQIRADTGLGTAAHWQPWDTKDVKGRMEVAKRFKNAVRCGVPFNNLVKEDGRFRRLPTLWICNTCPEFHKSIINWRYGEHVSTAVKVTNDPKSSPQQRFSHDNMVLECLAKDMRLLNAAFIMGNPARQMPKRHSVRL